MSALSQSPSVVSSGGSPATPYRVLARKYRPETFADLIGQDVLVRVLSAALESGRLSHAFLLTGVRGVGKTTTARILAKALNCVGQNNAQTAPTIEPCGVCEHCRAIREGRHIDVVEMDAASRTGIDDIREIIESTQYRPVKARYKVYIIDEVHMLSKNAFNALLKTLEEPPPQVIFIFATTELRKIPATVISRCQRFDLRRVEIKRLADHLISVAQREESKITPTAATMLARAAEGSVRDALSLLDTAISSYHEEEIDEIKVKTLLGLTDRGRLFDLLDHMMAGRAKDVLTSYHTLLQEGADPETLLGDLLTFIHWLTRLRITPDMETIADISEQQAQRGADMAKKLTIPVLSRAWQILLKGFQETRNAHSPIITAEMALIRLTYAADMPDPAALIQRITASDDKPEAPPASPSQPLQSGELPSDHAPLSSPVTPHSTNQETVSKPLPSDPPSDPLENTPPLEEHPAVKAVLNTFPGSRIDKISPVSSPSSPVSS